MNYESTSGKGYNADCVAKNFFAGTLPLPELYVKQLSHPFSISFGSTPYLLTQQQNHISRLQQKSEISFSWTATVCGTQHYLLKCCPNASLTQL